MAIPKSLFLGAGMLALGSLALVLDANTRPPRVVPRSPSPDLRISAAGRVEGRSAPSRLRFPITGQVIEVAVTEGQFVEAGQVLFRIDPESYLRELDRAQAELAVANGRLRLLIEGPHQQERNQAKALHDAQLAELAQAEAAFNRVRDLRLSDVATQQEFDRHRSQLQVVLANVAAAKSRLDLLQAPPREEEIQVARAQVDAARASVALAEFALRQTRLTAPVAGQILRVGTRLGELAGPQSAEPTIVLAQTQRLSVRAFVDEIDASRVAVGMSGLVTIDGSARQVRGHVVHVGPAVGPKSLWTGEPGERFDSDVREIWLELVECQDLVMGLRVEVLLDPTDSTNSPASDLPAAVARRPALGPGSASGNRRH